MDAHAHTHTHTHMHTHTHKRMHTRTHMHKNKHAHTCTHIHAHTYTHTCSDFHAHTHASVHAHTHHTHTHTKTHTHTHKHTHTRTHTHTSQVAEGHYRESISLAAQDVDIVGVGERNNIIIESVSKPVLSFRALKGVVRNLTLRQVFFFVRILQQICFELFLRPEPGTSNPKHIYIYITST